MRFIVTLLALLVSVILLVLFYNWTFNDRLTLIGFDKQPSDQTVRPIVVDVALSGFSLLMGILFGTVYERISKRQRLSLRTEFVKAIGSAHFAISLIIAPLIFAGVYSAARAQPDIVVASMFAFQNGFFL